MKGKQTVFAIPILTTVKSVARMLFNCEFDGGVEHVNELDVSRVSLLCVRRLDIDSMKLIRKHCFD